MSNSPVNTHVKTFNDMPIYVCVCMCEYVCVCVCSRVTLSLTYSLSVVPEERSLSSAAVAQGDDQS